MRISYSKKETKNLGNYENVSVEIVVEDDVDFTVETKDEAFERISIFVKNKLTEQFNKNTIKANVTSNKSNGSYIEDNDDQITPKWDKEKIKSYILDLIKLNPDNRIKIKQALESYGVNKLQDLEDYLINSFCLDLKKIRRECEYSILTKNE